MIKAIIIEDNQMSSLVLKSLIVEYCPEIKIVGVYFSGNEALLNMPKVDFDIMFLDIHLGDMTSFDLLEMLPENEYRIIFTTAFEEFALNAFKANAVDYLVKPVKGKELRLAVIKAQEKIITSAIRHDLLHNHHQHKSERLMIFNGNYRFIEFKDILFCKSEGNYTQFKYLDCNGKIVTHLESKLLKHFEETLQWQGFIRIHKSYLINRAHIIGVNTKPAQVVLSDGELIDISRDRKCQVIKELSE